MRAEDMVGVGFFALLLAAGAMALAGSRRSLTVRQRTLWRSWAFALLGCSLIGFGLANFELIRNSPQPVVEGNLWDIRDRFTGSQFMVTNATGHAVPIRCRYTGPGLVQGERATVRYVAYNGKLVQMEILTGSYQGWHLVESPGEWGYWVWVAAGLGCGLLVYRELSKVG
jgi:hypothetical protein